MALSRKLFLLLFMLLPLAAQAQQNQAYSRAEMLNALLTVNNGIQQIARLPSSHSKNQQLQQLAQRLTEDHRAFAQRVAQTAAELSLDPDQSAASRRFKDEAVRAEQRLQTLSGAAFDQAFLDQQAEAHLQAIGLVEGRLQPDADTPPLRTLLQDARGLLGRHLDQIDQLRKNGW